MKYEEGAPLESKSVAARRGDGMVLVLQSNQDKSLIIKAMNASVEALLGYADGELLGRRLGNDFGA